MDEAKLTRITEALYRVTDLMPDQEPLKWSLRKRALLITKLFWDEQRETVFKSKVMQHENITLQLRELLNLLELASATAYISRVNFEVLTREYQSFKSDLKALFKETPVLENSEMSFKKNIFTQSIENSQQKSPYGVGDGALEEKEKDTNVFKTEVVDRMVLHQKEHNVQTFTELSLVEREEKIIQYLRKHVWSGRKDIVKMFGGSISEKTVQRDLSLLVKKNVLKKIGEKRWCKYALKQLTSDN